LLQFLVLTLLALVLSFETGIGLFGVFALVSEVVGDARDFLVEFLDLILEVKNLFVLLFFDSWWHLSNLFLGLRLWHTLQRWNCVPSLRCRHHLRSTIGDRNRIHDGCQILMLLIAGSIVEKAHPSLVQFWMRIVRVVVR
jgi:hypothetical protein